MVKLMVVDDEIEICDFLTNYFSDKGYEVSLATSGDEAIRKSAEIEPDIVLCDIRMEKVSGLEVLRHLRKQINPPKMVMITAVHDSEVIEEARRLGAEDYMIKPFDLEYLDSVVLRKIATLIQGTV